MDTSTLQVRVQRIRDEAQDIRSFELVPTDAKPLPPFAPGSHVDVHLGPGLVRQYSLCNGPEMTASYLIACKKEPESRGGSQAMHERIKEGDCITISSPRNNFRLVPEARHHLLLAGGIGITPILAMSRHLLATGVSFALHYFTRSLEHTAFHDTLSRPEYRGIVDFRFSLDPDGLRAYLRRLLWERAVGAHLYLCGPKPFMDLVETVAAPTWPPSAVHLEYFSADPQSLAGPRGSFRVRLARGGGSYEVPESQSIIEVLRANGVEVETSCEQGVCGTCLTGVLEGEPDHRDVYLSADEHASGKKMMVCVSRAKSATLVLDI